MMGKRIIFIPGMSASIIVLALAATVLPLQAQKGFGGQWNSSLGNMELYKQGARVTGSYQRGSNTDGQIEGTLSYSGEILSGTWTVDDGAGRYLMRLLNGGTAFYGRWWTPRGTPGGFWIGVKPNSDYLQNNVKAADFAGEWQTNYGAMTIEVEGNKISAGYRGKVNAGTMKGAVEEVTNKLVATWKDSKYTGKVIISMLKGGEGFVGRWWYADGEYGGLWYGVRRKVLSGCLQGDCDNGTGTYIWADGRRYSGGWLNSNYHGDGRQYKADGEVDNIAIWNEGLLIGQRVSGSVINGSGTLKFANGNSFSGFFKDAQADSSGTFEYSNGNKYTGVVNRGQAHGRGTYTWANGDRYEGDFKVGRLDGSGVYTFASGDAFSGEFRRGKRHGDGTMTFAQGDRYEGRWRNDGMLGRGVYLYRGGDKYEGQFRNGLKHGRGTYTFRNGSFFDATWRDGHVMGITASSGIANPTPEGVAAALLMANEAAAATREPSDMPVGNSWVFYRETENQVDYGEGVVNEVTIDYYVVQAEAALNETATRDFLARKLERDFTGYLVEKTDNPDTFLRQYLNRYRFAVLPTRVNPVGARYYKYEPGK